MFESDADRLHLVVPRGWRATDQPSYPGLLLWMMRTDPPAQIVVSAEPLTHALFCSWPVACRSVQGPLTEQCACAVREQLAAKRLRVGPVQQGPKENAAAGMASIWFGYHDGCRFLRQALALSTDRAYSLVLASPTAAARSAAVRAFDQALRSIRVLVPPPTADAAAVAGPRPDGGASTAPLPPNDGPTPDAPRPSDAASAAMDASAIFLDGPSLDAGVTFETAPAPTPLGSIARPCVTTQATHWVRSYIRAVFDAASATVRPRGREGPMAAPAPLTEAPQSTPTTDAAANHSPSSPSAPPRRAPRRETNEAALWRTTEPRLVSDETVEAAAIVASLGAASFALGEPSNARETDGHAHAAQGHLNLAVNAARHYGGTIDEAAVRRQADAFDQAMARFLIAAKDSSPAVETLIDTNLSMRKFLAFPLTSTRSSAQKEHGTTASHVAAALRPALHLIYVRNRDALTSLASCPQGEREQVIASLVQDLRGNVEYAGDLLRTFPHEERKAFEADLDVVAKSALEVLRWIRTRTSHAGMEKLYKPQVDALDRVLLSGGTRMVESRPAEALNEGATQSGMEEQSHFSAAQATLMSKIKQVNSDQVAAITEFASLAALQDAEPPEFMEELFMAVLAATIGQVAGGFVSLIASGFTKAMSRSVQYAVGHGAEAAAHGAEGAAHGGLAHKVTEIAIDAATILSDKALGESASGSSGAVLAAFVASMTTEAAARVAGLEDNIIGLVAASSITADEMAAMAEALTTSTRGIATSYKRAMVASWAQYNMRAGLAARTFLGHKGHKTKLKDYFGTRIPSGREFGTSKENTTGVFSITMRIEHPGTAPVVEDGASRVNGMNESMAEQMMEAAAHRLNRIPVAKEVHVKTESATAKLLVDEHNELRDSADWDLVSQKVGIDSAFMFWKIYGKDVRV